MLDKRLSNNFFYNSFFFNLLFISSSHLFYIYIKEGRKGVDVEEKNEFLRVFLIAFS